MAGAAACAKAPIEAIASVRPVAKVVSLCMVCPVKVWLEEVCCESRLSTTTRREARRRPGRKDL